MSAELHVPDIWEILTSCNCCASLTAFLWILRWCIPLVLNELDHSTAPRLSLEMRVGVLGAWLRSVRTWRNIWMFFTHSSLAFTSASHDDWLIQASLWVFHKNQTSTIKENVTADGFRFMYWYRMSIGRRRMWSILGTPVGIAECTNRKRWRWSLR